MSAQSYLMEEEASRSEDVAQEDISARVWCAMHSRAFFRRLICVETNAGKG